MENPNELDTIFGGETEDDELDTFIGDDTEQAAPLPGSYVILLSSTGTSHYVPVAADEETDGMPGVTLRTVLSRSGLTFGANNDYFIGSQPTNQEALVTAGATVTVLGTMKGGRA